MAEPFVFQMREAWEQKISAFNSALNDALTEIDTDSVDSRWAVDIYRTARSKRHFKDEFVSVEIDRGLFLIAESPRPIISSKRGVTFWFWDNPLYPMCTLTSFWKSTSQIDPVMFIGYFKTNSSEADRLCKQPTTIILLRGRQCISALQIDVSKIDLANWEDLFPKTPPMFIGDALAGKIWVYWRIRNSKKAERSPHEELERAWAERLCARAQMALDFYYDPMCSKEREEELDRVVTPSGFGEEFTISENPAALLFNGYSEMFWRKHFNIPFIVETTKDQLAAAPLHRDFLLQIMECTWFSSEGTACGKRVMSINSDLTTTEVPIDVSGLGNRAKLFWERMPFEFPFNHAQLFGSAALPMEIRAFVEKAFLYEGDLKNGQQFVDDLLAEAVAFKQWTIPWGAYVQLEFGNVKAVKLFELSEDIACVLVNQEGEHLLVWVNPRINSRQFTQSGEIANTAGLVFRERAIAKGESLDDPQLTARGQDSLDRLFLGIEILLAATIRDFWVVEERERVFGASSSASRVPRLKSDRGKQVIAYLPRVRYVGNIQNRGDDLDLVARRAHFVTGHLRKALHASEEQIQLARRHGIIVPEGFTFVRPHRRGDEVQERIYRSRSALHCIQALDPIDSAGTRDSWFQYELNVKNWLKANGFEVEHLAGNRNGDGGVDIQAFKAEEHLLVQCKYWKTVRVGPAVVREMLGVLKTFPEGARGVIITSSELTEGARNLAIQHGIQFIENANFSKEINVTIQFSPLHQCCHFWRNSFKDPHGFTAVCELFSPTT